MTDVVKPIPNLNAASSDVDLYCLNCGYNLRGLTGDPRRCPECGHLNPLGDLELPAELIRGQLRRMETAPAMCLAGILLAAAALIPFVLLTAYFDEFDLEVAICPGTLLLISAGIWVTGVRRFRSSCLQKRGWGPALRRYHAYGLAMAVPIPVVIFGTFAGLTWLSEPTAGVHVNPMIGVGGVLAVLAFIRFVGPWGHRRAIEEMQPLQREVAVTLAKERLQQALRRPRGGGSD